MDVAILAVVPTMAELVALENRIARVQIEVSKAALLQPGAIVRKVRLAVGP